MTADERVHERRLQKKHDSFVITVPRDMVQFLGAKVGQSLRFTAHNKTVMLTVGEPTKKEVDEQDKYARELDRMMKESVRDVEETRRRQWHTSQVDAGEDAGPDRPPAVSKLEKLRIR